MPRPLPVRTHALPSPADLTPHPLAGALRWQAPQPPSTTPGVQPATAQPAECFQGPTGAAPTNPFRNSTSKRAAEVATSEDCLFLKFVV